MSTIDPLHPEHTAPAIIPEEHGAELPETVPLRKGILLELAAQYIYSDEEQENMGGAGSRGGPTEFDCICSPDTRLQHCPNCVNSFMTFVHTRLRPGASDILGDLQLSAGEAERWPALARVFNDGAQSQRTWFGTPDRLETRDKALIGTEFKAGSARLDGTQRLLAEAWAEVGVPIIIARLTAENSGGPHPNQLCRIPRSGEETFGVIRTYEDESAAEVKFGDTSLVEYWQSRGETIDPADPVYGIEYYPRRPLSLYPRSLVTPVHVRIARDEVIDAVAEPFPWNTYPEVLSLVKSREEIREQVRRDREERIRKGEPVPNDLPFLTLEQVRTFFPEYRGTEDAEIEREQQRIRELFNWSDD